MALFVWTLFQYCSTQLKVLLTNIFCLKYCMKLYKLYKCVYIVFWMYLLFLQLGLSRTFCHIICYCLFEAFHEAVLHWAGRSSFKCTVHLSVLYFLNRNLKLASLLFCKQLFDFFTFAAEGLHSPNLPPYLFFLKLFSILNNLVFFSIFRDMMMSITYWKEHVDTGIC